MELFRRIGRVLIAAVVGIVCMLAIQSIAGIFGGGYANDHHMIPGTSVIAMSAIVVLNVIMCDLLGDDVLKGKHFDIIKMAIFFICWLDIVNEMQIEEIWRIEAIENELGTNLLAKAVVYGGYISPSVAAFFSYCASISESGTRESLATIHPQTLLISIGMALAILLISIYVPFVKEHLTDILWIVPNALVGIFMLIKRTLPYQRYYGE